MWVQVCLECIEVQWDSQCRGMQRSEGIEYGGTSACRDQQDTVGMGMYLPVDSSEGQRGSECS